MEGFMLHSESNWQTTDGIAVFGQTWEPEGDIKAVVVLIHGLGEHSSRYRHVAEFFSRAGYALATMDLRGHGKSAGIRGHFSSFQAIKTDIQQLIEKTQTDFPGKPLFLYGHSLGGALTLFYTMTEKAHLTGVIVTAPGIAAGTPVAPAKLIAAKVLSSLAPQFTIKNGLDFNSLSHDPDVKAVYLKDPLVHPMISTRLGNDLLNTGMWIRSQSGKYPYPLLIMQGEDDRIVDPASVKKFAEGLSGDVTFRSWSGMCHELHNEYEKEEVLNLMVEWMDKRCPS
jgi:acylglycerol lipase